MLMTMHSKLVIPLTNLEFQKWKKKNQHKMRNVKGKEANIEIQQVVGFNFTLPSQIAYD